MQINDTRAGTYLDCNDTQTFFLAQKAEFQFISHTIITTFITGRRHGLSNNLVYSSICYNAKGVLQEQMKDDVFLVIMKDNSCTVLIVTMQYYQ